mmetsp:Transcript_87121/g.154182  ORF Transcript_87121/g.154182 Transcript_87121/m.154182 type:complete len:258 (-) Transcript_87121:1494-2267(-)
MRSVTTRLCHSGYPQRPSRLRLGIIFLVSFKRANGYPNSCMLQIVQVLLPWDGRKLVRCHLPQLASLHIQQRKGRLPYQVVSLQRVVVPQEDIDPKVLHRNIPILLRKCHCNSLVPGRICILQNCAGLCKSSDGRLAILVSGSHEPLLDPRASLQGIATNNTECDIWVDAEAPIRGLGAAGQVLGFFQIAKHSTLSQRPLQNVLFLHALPREGQDPSEPCVWTLQHHSYVMSNLRDIFHVLFAKSSTSTLIDALDGT